MDKQQMPKDGIPAPTIPDSTCPMGDFSSPDPVKLAAHTQVVHGAVEALKEQS